jgi:peptidoglycan-associated lipoprotein
MKTKLIFSLALGMVIVAASTGCKSESPDVAPISPGPGSTISSGRSYNVEQQATLLPNNWTLQMMNQDREALATDAIHFEFDSAVIRNSEETHLQSVAATLQSDPSTKLLVEGNCDERGTEEYNRSLGERRALSSREALAQLGVDPMRITTIS